MKTIMHVVGARPNFPKVAPVMRALRARGAVQTLMHTGQHYDDAMSDSFFRDLSLPTPDVLLGVGSGSHAEQTSSIMLGVERCLIASPPSIVVVYGDVNSTLAAALVAAKLNIPVAHVEAGLRSFDMTMPEEVNRRVTDQIAQLLLVTSPEAIGHLAREGVPQERIHFVGNPMIDTLLANLHKMDTATAMSKFDLHGDYAVATLHRPSNVDSISRAGEVVRALTQIGSRIPILLALHPRGRANLLAAGLDEAAGVRVTDPINYLEFVSLVRGARAVITDSGGIQEECTLLGVPCLTLRPNTERPVTITHGTNRLTDIDRLSIDMDDALERPDQFRRGAPPLWDGKSGARIAELLMDFVHGNSAVLGGSTTVGLGWAIGAAGQAARSGAPHVSARGGGRSALEVV